MHREHILPKWAGGADDDTNIQFLCANCHEDKTFEERRSAAYRAYVSKQVTERMLSPEARANISRAVKESNAKRDWTPEMKARIGRPGIKRKPFTEQHRANLSAAMKMRWDKRP